MYTMFSCFQSLGLSKLVDVHSDLNIPVPDPIPVNGTDEVRHFNHCYTTKTDHSADLLLNKYRNVST